MLLLKNTLFIVLLCFLFSCKKDEDSKAKEIPPFAAAGTNQDDIDEFQVLLNADSLKTGQTGEWNIESGLVEEKVFFSNKNLPNARFNGMPGETYQLQWTVKSGATTYSQSSVKITFKPLKAIIESSSLENRTKFFVTGNNYERGIWTVEGKYAMLLGQSNGGTSVPSLNDNTIEFQGYARTKYKLTWTISYGSKKASTTLEFTSGDYQEDEALMDLQLDNTSRRLIYENGHIVSLDLSASGITWIMKDTVTYPALQALIYLKNLNLKGSATFDFPVVIGAKYLQLETLNLEDVPLFSLADNIGNLRKLKRLDISTSGIANIYTLPESFGDLESLEVLMVSRAHLKVLPESMSKLKSLRIFDCGLGPIQRLPTEIGNLTNLETLIASTIDNIPSSITKLKKLRRLVYTSGSNYAELPENFGNISALDTLILQGRFQRLPESLCNLDLKALDISSSVLQALPENFGNMTNIISLHVYGAFNSFPKSFTKLTKLNYLYLSCKAETLPDDFGKLTGLVYFSSQLGKLKRLPNSMGDLINLEEIALQQNEIEDLPPGFFNLPKIRKLNLSINKLSSLSDDFSKLANSLQYLYLYGNEYPAEDLAHIKTLLPNSQVFGSTDL